MKYFYFIFFLLSILFTKNQINAIPSKADEKIKLNSGMELEKTLTASEEHIYTAELKNGTAIIGEVIQDGIDIVIDIHNPLGQHISQLDSPNGAYGPETIDFTSRLSGEYKFVVHSLDKDAQKGKYQIKVEHFLSVEVNAKRIAKKEIPSQILFDLWEASLSDESAADKFIEKQTSNHLIEPIKENNIEMLVTYFCIPDEDTEYAMQSGGPDFLGLRFHRLGNTKLFVTSHIVPKDARFNYGFNYFKLYKAGPNGEIITRKIEHTYDGTVIMPNAPEQLYIVEKEGIPKGKIQPTKIQSKFLNEERQITIYTPAGYDGKTPHNLLIIFDGEEYGARLGRRASVPTPTILDNLIAENKITSTIAIFIWSMGKRNQDLISKTFADFVGEELIRWVRSNYNIHSRADHVVVAGSSRGGYAASYIALQHSRFIGNVLSQSGSYWIKGTEDENHWMYPKDSGKLINAFKKSKKLPIKFYMEVGLYDAGASMLGTNRQLRDILETKGYQVDYREFNGGHSYVNWRGSLSNGLISLIGK